MAPWDPQAHKLDKFKGDYVAEDPFISKRFPYKVLLMSKHSTFQMDSLLKKNMTKTKIITICIHYLRRSSCEESKAHLFLIKAPASPSPGGSGELQRRRNSGDRDEGIVSIKPILL